MVDYSLWNDWVPYTHTHIRKCQTSPCLTQQGEVLSFLTSPFPPAHSAQVLTRVFSQAYGRADRAELAGSGTRRLPQLVESGSLTVIGVVRVGAC